MLTISSYAGLGVLAITICAMTGGWADAKSESLLVKGKTLFVDNVWAGMPVGFAMAVRDGKQYVAYYDAERWMSVACRSLDSETWQKVRLDNQIGWDSHNGITFAFDPEGYIHLSGNMHGVPLRYYRTSKPGDITTFEPIHRMTGVEESRVTYPHFYTGPNGEFLFTYRDGGSGNGNNIINVYDVRTKTWRRYTQRHLFDGEGLMNAYAAGPARDSNGTYHLAWVWRDHGGCESNHDVSYARSPGSLENWQKSNGEPVELPLTIHNTEIIDSVQVNSGLMNSVKISFDGLDRPMVTYIKFDPKGKTQIYTMRLENGRWKRYQTTKWNDRWEFSGGGTIFPMISFSGPTPWAGSDRLYQTFTNRYMAPYQQVRFLDKDKLQQVGEAVRIFPEGFDTPDPEKGDQWQVNILGASIEAARKTGATWALRWESMISNRDRPREAAPPPSRLELVELRIREEWKAEGKS